MTDEATQETGGELLARLGTDGELWATEFGTRFSGQVIVLDAADDADPVAVNGGTLIGWFANAIEAGRSAGRAEGVEADDHAALIIERDQLQAERDNLAAELDKAVARYQVARRKHEGKGRAVGTGKFNADPDTIAEALGGPVELVFSDGKKEITGIDPVHVSGRAAWASHPTGQMLRDRVLLSGPAPAEGVFTVAGVGLLVDGKQVGWCAFHDPVSVAGGATAELRDSIIF